MNQVDTAEIKRLRNDVGPGDWHLSPTMGLLIPTTAKNDSTANAALIVHMVNNALAIAAELDALRAERMELRGTIIQTLPWLKDPIPGDVARYCLWALKQDTTPSPLQAELDANRIEIEQLKKHQKPIMPSQLHSPNPMAPHEWELHRRDQRIAELEAEVKSLKFKGVGAEQILPKPKRRLVREGD